MINILMIVGFIILIAVLIKTFGSMSEGLMGPIIVVTAIGAIFTSYKDNADAGWVNIGTSAAKIFMLGIVASVVFGILTYYTFYIKEEVSQWISNKHENKKKELKED